MTCDRCIYEKEERSLLETRELILQIAEDFGELSHRGLVKRALTQDQASIHRLIEDRLIDTAPDQQVAIVYCREYGENLNMVALRLLDDAKIFRVAIDKLPCNCHKLNTEDQ